MYYNSNHTAVSNILVQRIREEAWYQRAFLQSRISPLEFSNIDVISRKIRRLKKKHASASHTSRNKSFEKGSINCISRTRQTPECKKTRRREPHDQDHVRCSDRLVAQVAQPAFGFEARCPDNFLIHHQHHYATAQQTRLDSYLYCHQDPIPDINTHKTYMYEYQINPQSKMLSNCQDSAELVFPNRT